MANKLDGTASLHIWIVLPADHIDHVLKV